MSVGVPSNWKLAAIYTGREKLPILGKVKGLLEIPDSPDLPADYSKEALAATNQAIRGGRASALLALNLLKSKWELDRFFQEHAEILVRSILCQKLVACLLDDSVKDLALITSCLVEMGESEQFTAPEIIYAGQAAFGLFSHNALARKTLFEDLSQQPDILLKIPAWHDLIVRMAKV